MKNTLIYDFIMYKRMSKIIKAHLNKIYIKKKNYKFDFYNIMNLFDITFHVAYIFIGDLTRMENAFAFPDIFSSRKN